MAGGVFQLRQGQQRRVCIRVRPVRDSGTLPLVCETVTCVEIGSVSVRSKLQKQLDSYQEEDLLLLRDKWSDAVARRRQHLDQQLQRLMQKSDKSESDVEREQSLVNQWVSLTEERNTVLIPVSGSGIPGNISIIITFILVFKMFICLPRRRSCTKRLDSAVRLGTPRSCFIS